MVSLAETQACKCGRHFARVLLARVPSHGCPHLHGRLGDAVRTCPGQKRTGDESSAMASATGGTTPSVEERAFETQETSGIDIHQYLGRKAEPL